MSVPDEKRCKGTSRTTGKRCGLKAIPPSKFCQYHGAQALGNRGNRTARGVPKGTPKPPGAGRGAEKGSTRAMTTGVATPKMPAEMEAVRQALLTKYLSDMEGANFFDEMSLGRAAAIEAKFIYAIADPECPSSTLDTLHRILHRELRALKATREMRDVSKTGTTPAEVIAAIMVKVSERRRQIEEDREPSGRMIEHRTTGSTVAASGVSGRVIQVNEDVGEQDDSPVQSVETDPASDLDADFEASPLDALWTDDEMGFPAD